MSLKHENILNPITALQFYQADKDSETLWLLAGEGPYLKAFDVATSKLVSQCKVFHDQVIHGIEVHQGIAIWGGPQLVLIPNAKLNSLLGAEFSCIAGTGITLLDWVLDVSICPFDPFTCAVITAHNVVLRVRLIERSDQIELSTPSSPLRSILYSAHLIWESSSQLLIAAGTVFGEIVLWKCYPDATSQILLTCTGHEGSIFGVKISAEFELPDGQLCRLLASCSDDRTIRVWGFPNDPTAVALSDLLLPRETGFGPSCEVTHDNTALAVIMGHASRIWRVEFILSRDFPGECSVNLLSFGEDATMQQWRLEFTEVLAQTPRKSIQQTESETPKYSLELVHIKTFAFHDGKHVSSYALKASSHGSYCLSTGGADGKIAMYDVHIAVNKSRETIPIMYPEIASNENPKQAFPSSSWEIEYVLSTIQAPAEDTSSPSGKNSSDQISGKLTRKNKSFPRDCFNRYAFASENEILATTALGRVFRGIICTAVRWVEIKLPEFFLHDLKSYAVIRGFPDLGRAYLGGGNGKIFVYHDGRILHAGVVDGKITDMFKIYEPVTETYSLLVTTLNSSTAKLFRLVPESHGLAEHSNIGLSKRFVVTSAGIVNSLLILGSRFGSLAIYGPLCPETPLKVYSNAEITGDAITAILSLPATNCGEHVSYFLTTGKNGLYSIFLITDQNATEMHLRAVHHGTSPLGPIIENAWFDGHNLLLYGFKGKNFIVWDEGKKYEIMNVECGGAHRSYAFVPPSRNGGGHFVYTRASRLYIHTCKSPSHQIVRPGGHGREIKTCAVSQDRKLVATGAEDTTIRIWRYSDQSTGLQCQTVIQKHTAGIQHVQWIGSSYLFSSAGNEEFFIWSIESIPNFGIGVVCIASCPDQTEEKDLRIMSFDVTTISSSGGNEVLISLAFSDSTFRTYVHSPSKTFTLIADGRYTSSCINQIRHIKMSDQGIYILTAATDGVIAVWISNATRSGTLYSPSNLKLLTTKKLHQNTIKSLDLKIFNRHLCVATGGDDGALGISIYNAMNLELSSISFVLNSAHTAAITGLTIISTSLNEPIKLVTSSNDQRVKVWGLQATEDACREFSLSIKTQGNEFVSVADVGDLVSFRDSRSLVILVVGNGMEAWSIDQAGLDEISSDIISTCTDLHSEF